MNLPRIGIVHPTTDDGGEVDTLDSPVAVDKIVFHVVIGFSNLLLQDNAQRSGWLQNTEISKFCRIILVDMSLTSQFANRGFIEHTGNNNTHLYAATACKWRSP